MKAKGWGGPRRGAGRRPELTDEVRRNRVVVLLTDGELAKLQAAAEERDLPTGTMAYEVMARWLRRQP